MCSKNTNTNVQTVINRQKEKLQAGLPGFMKIYTPTTSKKTRPETSSNIQALNKGDVFFPLIFA